MPGKGRAIDRDKMRAIVQAAQAHFYRDGVDATRIEDIAATAGVSKVTIYNRFTDKAGLLTACVEAECDRMQEEIEAEIADASSFRERLDLTGQVVLSFLFSEAHVAFERVMAAEGLRNPAFARSFYEAGPARIVQRLCALLEQGRATGEIAIDDIEGAAEHLLGMWRGMADLRARFSQRPAILDQAAISMRVGAGTDRFLAAYHAPNRTPLGVPRSRPT